MEAKSKLGSPEALCLRPRRSMSRPSSCEADTDVRHRIDTAAIEPQPPRRAQKSWRLADAIAAIAVKQCRILPVQLGAFLAHNIDGHLRAVLGGRELTHHFDVGKGDGRGDLER